MLSTAGRRARARAASEDGVSLIEILISALMLGLIVISTLTAFDAAGRITSDQQRRSQANALAQQDEDRLRGMQVSQLSNLNQTRSVTVNANNGTTFTIVSTGAFQTDSTGTDSCASSATADYIKTKSTVTWPNIGSRPPVVAESIVTPPVGGSLVVQVVDSQGNGVPNMTVSGSGPTTVSGTTSAAGCAIFGALPDGTYNVTVSQPGYVDPNGNSSPPANQQATTVVGAATDRMTFQYDRAGQIATTFDTKYGGAVHASSADTVAIFNNNMTLPSFRWAGTSGSYASTVSASSMFPFSSAYTVYAGSCAKNAPSQNGQSTDPTVVVPPGGPGSLLLHLPALLLTVWSGTSATPGSVVSRPHVVLTDVNCGGSPPTAGGSPPIKRVPTTTTSGTLLDPGQPYGTFTVCADSGNKYALANNVANRDPVNGVTVNLYLGSGSSGVCT